MKITNDSLAWLLGRHEADILPTAGLVDQVLILPFFLTDTTGFATDNSASCQ
jgi:hypothetical protein